MLMLNWNVCGGVLVKAEMCCVLDIDRSHQEALSRCVISLLEKPGDTPFQPPTSWKKFKMEKKHWKNILLSLSNAGWPPSSLPIERVDPPEKTFLSQRLLVKTKQNLFGKNKTKLLVKKNLARSPTLLLSLTGHISNKTSDGVQFSFSEKLSWFTSPCGQFLSFTNREPLKRQGGVGSLFKIITWMHNFERLSTNFRLFQEPPTFLRGVWESSFSFVPTSSGVCLDLHNLT